MSTKIKVNEWYYTDMEPLFCCDFQYRTICEKHDEVQGCYYCEFDYSKPCECE